MKIYLPLSVIFIISSLPAAPAGQDYKHPIILIPGDGGCRLEAKVNLQSTPNFFCKKRSDDYFLLWANPKYFLPYVINCFVNLMRLIRDPVTGLTSNPPGVDIRVPGWGKTYAVEWLSNIHIGPLSYYKSIVDALVKQQGYTRDVNIRGAPFDWRKAPNELGQYYSDFRKLIEETSAANGNRSVVLVSHSYGGPATLHFLQHQEQEWKDKFIKSFVSIAGAFGGSSISVKVMASGDSFGIPTVSANTVRRHQRTLPSTVYLLPKMPAWKSDALIAMTDTRNYTISDYDAFYRDMGVPEAIPLTSSVLYITNVTQGPGVPVHCVMTRTTSTPDIYDWRGLNFPDKKPKSINGEGDGTVNWRSLNLCPEFSKSQSHPVTTTLIENTDHSGILKDKRMIDFMLTSVI